MLVHRVLGCCQAWAWAHRVWVLHLGSEHLGLESHLALEHLALEHPVLEHPVWVQHPVRAPGAQVSDAVELVLIAMAPTAQARGQIEAAQLTAVVPGSGLTPLDSLI